MNNNRMNSSREGSAHSYASSFSDVSGQSGYYPPENSRRDPTRGSLQNGRRPPSFAAELDNPDRLSRMSQTTLNKYKNHLEKTKTRGLQLKNNLYDTPGKSEVILQSKYPKLPRISPDNGDTGTMLSPKPPPPRSAEGSGKTLRTTMFKRDYKKRKDLLKTRLQRADSSEALKLTVNNLHKQAIEGNIEPVERAMSESEITSVLSDDPVVDNQDLNKKKVAFAEDVEPPVPEVVQEPVEDHVQHSLDDVESVKSEHTVDSMDSKDSDASATFGDRVIPASQSKGIVLTYAKKNRYDDTQPENDNFIEVLTQMRRKLNWVVDLPRHGAGTRSFVENLTDFRLDPLEVKTSVKEDPGEFIYALPRDRANPRGRYNPYNLQVVSANSARRCHTYWTASASMITMVEVDDMGQETMTLTPALQWMWARRLYYMIYEIPVFVKFRIWKTFQVWKLSVKHKKTSSSVSVMHKQLFMANEILCGCMIHVQGLCQAASGSLTGYGQGDSAVCLVKVDKSVTMTLDEFVTAQQQQGEAANKQLEALRQQIIDLVWESCATVAEMEGITHGIRSTDRASSVPKTVAKQDEQTEKKPQKWDRKSRLAAKYEKNPKKEQVLEEATRPKSNRPLYAQVAEWRRILARLSQFLKTIDYILIEFLRRLVKTGLKTLLNFLILSHNTLDDEDDDEDDFSVDSDDDTYGRSAAATPNRPDSSLGGTPSVPGSASSSARKWRKGRTQKGHKQEAYVIPHYDWSEMPEESETPDVDQVLQEAKQQGETVDVAKPAISIQLVLNVPELLPASRSRRSRARSRGGVDPQEAARHVTFPEDTEGSETDSDEYSDSEEDDEEHGESRAQNNDEEADTFAYNAEMNKRMSVAKQGTASVTPSSSVLSRTHATLEPSEQTVKMEMAGIISGFEAIAGMYQMKMAGIISGFEAIAAKFVAMLREPQLAVFYSPPKYTLHLNYDDEEEPELLPWPDMYTIFCEDVEYQEMNSELMQTIQAAIEQTIDFARAYSEFCTMVERSRQVDVTASMAKKAWTTEDFNHVLSTHTEQVTMMNRMVSRKRLGLLELLARNFRESCLPYPMQVLKAVSGSLPKIAYDKNDALLNIVKKASKKLDAPLTSVDEFVEHLSFLAKMQGEMPTLEKEYEVVTKLYTISKDFDIDIEPEELALYQTLGPSFQHLRSTILFCDAKKEENIHQFSADLTDLLQDIHFNLMEIKNKVRDPMLLNVESLPSTALESIRFLQDQVTSLTVKARAYGNYQERFGSNLQHKKPYGEDYLLIDKRDGIKAHTVQAELSEVDRDLTLRRLLWESQEEFTRLVEEWTATSFEKLNVESLQKHVNRFSQTVYMLEKGLPNNEVVPKLKERVFDFKQGMPVITSLRNPSLRARHWNQIERLIGSKITGQKDRKFTLGNLLEMSIFTHKEKIQDISTTASNEATLEVMLQKVIDLWQNTDFRLVPHGGRDTFIISGADDILAQLEESQVTMGTIRGSRYVTPIKGTVEDWERKLNLFARTLDEWMNCQRNWLYLEQIFSTPDIQRQLPSESKMFLTVDKNWKDIMRKTEDRPNALKAAIASGVLEMLQASNVSLEKIQKCLEDYLETKRLVFPRFYFLSNDELLDILAQSKNPDAVQPHLGKCFGNVKFLDIKSPPRQPPTVKSMSSFEGETVQMPKNVRARGPVEQWLCGVENGMFDTVKRHLKLGLSDWLGIGHDEWVIKHPGQVVLTVTQIMFNREVQMCFNAAHPKKALSNLKDKMVDTLNLLAGLVSTNLPSHKCQSLEAMLTIDVHNRDIIAGMADNDVSSPENFEWTKQIRYEWDETRNNCIILQSNAVFVYGYEYLGCSPRLVMTPLTDRCYLTLTGALHLNLGGSPAGPAGTGKTETCKDLAKAMGKQCVVFNCSEGLDYKMLGKFFSGMAQAGTWCCFDEFNRIDIEVLSVVAQQIHTIKTAKDQQATRFLFEGRDIKLNTTCGVFITMNPSYAGRVELPDNLKSLFRSVAMMVPDYALIAEIILFSEGFTAAKSLSGKIVNLYQLSSKQLSQQDHYDFGMRAIKSVLVMAGHRKRHMQVEVDTEVTSQDKEAHILIHALRDANLPKFIAEDVPLFESILADLFPGISPPQQELGALEKAISMSVRDCGLQHWPSQIDKVKQLYSQILVRHGVMLVGPTGGGKTTTRNILQRALVLLPTLSADQKDQEKGKFTHNRNKKGHVETFSINPKCVKLGELYGETDPNTFEWTDGLIATAVRRFAREVANLATSSSGDDRSLGTVTPVASAYGGGREPSAKTSSTPGLETPEVPGASISAESRVTSSKQADLGDDSASDHNRAPTDWRWLVLDGPVDTLWVENLNTVLDDSKILCLANGERISLGPGMRLLFEVDNLAQASPATISRCAMVYMDPVDLGWTPFVKTWISRLPKEMPESGKNYLLKMFNTYLEKGVNFWKLYSKHQLVPAPEMSIVMSLCNILSAFLDFMDKNGGYGQPDKEPIATTRPGSPAGSDKSKSSSTKEEKKKAKAANKRSNLKTIKEGGATKPSASKEQTGPPSKQYYLQKNPNQLINILGKLFVFAYTWSIGGTFKRSEDLDDDGGLIRRDQQEKAVDEINLCYEFDNFMHETFETPPPFGVRLPSGNKTIYSYFVDMESSAFILWDDLVPKTKSLIEKGAMISIADAMGGGHGMDKPKQDPNELVVTVDTVRYSFLASLLLLQKNPVLLTGESGVGKSAIVNDMLKRLGRDGGTTFKHGTVLGSVMNFTDKNASLLENISSLTKSDGDKSDSKDFLLGGRVEAKPRHTGIVSTMLQFTAQTSSARTQAQIILKLIKKGRDQMGGPKGRKIIVFLDDLNMPAPEQYGAQPPLELLRQFLDHSGFFDTQKLAWKNIMDVTTIAACAPPGGGRNPISPRLLKHFCILALPTPSTRSLQHIYQVQLGRFLHEGEFMPDVKECLFPLVSASISIYYRMCSIMLPTPAKSHYTFNIRDLSQVVTGLLQANEEVIVNKENCAHLFTHEVTRVFHDRLVDKEDRTTFFACISETLMDYFKGIWDPQKLQDEPVLFGDFLDMDSALDKRIYRPISAMDKLTRLLEEFNMRQLNLGNSQSSQVVFFKEAVEHIVRAARVFRQPGGHMMLVGLDGTGKQTTVTLSTLIMSATLYVLTLTRGYNVQDFHDDLKNVYKTAGVKGKNTVFMLTDSDIVKESFLEDINCILNSGDVPDLFDNEELDGIMMDLKQEATLAGIPDTRASVYQFFLQRVRKNLHIVLTMSPAGKKFRQRCRMNPALINCCTIDWYDEWDREAMLSVANVYFDDEHFMMNRFDETTVDLKQNVAEKCVDVHHSVATATNKFWEEMRRRYYITPSSYMELIKNYAHMLKNQKTKLMDNRDRLMVGLSKLSEANSLVGTMQEELVSLGPKIEEKARDTETLLEQLRKDQEAVDQVRTIVEQEESVMKKETQVVQNYADECQRDLASVLPALQTAIGSLDRLDKSDIAEIKVYHRPPQMVKIVMNAVCTLLQTKPDWPAAVKLLADSGFLKKLVHFDKNNLPDSVFVKLRKFTKHEDFVPEKVGSVSLACRSICEWVLALEHYNEVYKMVKPKQKRVDEAREALELAQNHLAQKQESLSKIMDHLNLLQQQYQDSVNQRESLKERKILTGQRIERASVLINALADEKIRWADSVDDLDFKLKGVVGDTLVAAAAVSYLGAFMAKYRRELIDSWIALCKSSNIPLSVSFNLVKSLADANEVLLWHNEGLPQDNHSTENAVILKNSRKWPLLIDPQGQASKWIGQMEGEKLKVVQASDPNYMRTMENAIRVGDPVLLQECTEVLDPQLKPILLRDTFTRAGQTVIKLGDTEIEYNDNFRLYMATIMSNPHYLPSVCIHVTLINFTVTFDGLQEQLLSSVVRQERPVLENQRCELLENIANDLQLLRDLEDKSLSLLQKSEGHILDDKDLVHTLQKSKLMSAEIKKRVKESEETEKNLNTARMKYLPVATRGAVLYFVLSDLSNINVMYQFSLPWFQRMFTTCIDLKIDKPMIPSGSVVLTGTLRPSLARSSPDLIRNQKKDKDTNIADSLHDLNKRMTEMIQRLTWNVFRVVSIAVFSHHQLVFSFLLCANIMQAKARYPDDIVAMGRIEEKEWMVFLQGNILASMLDEKTAAKYDGLSPMQRLEVENTGKEIIRANWITDTMWRQCQHLESIIESFEYLCRSLMNYHQQWDKFAETDNPFHMLAVEWKHDVVPGEEGPGERELFHWEALTRFHRLILIKILRPDMFNASVRVFIEEQMGEKYISHGNIDLRDIFKETNAKGPIIFLLAPGSDPAMQLLRFAEEFRGSALHLDMISLGRGQGPKAEELIAKAQILKGRWVFLQNCHLAASWMPRLQSVVENFNKPNSDVDPQFRLWLSSKPDPSFPISILHAGLKMTVESPKGLKANMLRLYSPGSVLEKTFEEFGSTSHTKNLLFGLCLFNSVIHERKKYGALGWNIPYEFNESDLEVSILTLKMLVQSEDSDSLIPWAALCYLTGEVNYGGRVTDDWDRRCLHSLLLKFYTPEALEADYTYSADKIYHPLPKTFGFSEFRDYIEGFPTSDTPQIFGMNENAEKAFLESEAKDFIDILVSVQPKMSVQGMMVTGKSSDEVVLEILADISNSLPEEVEESDDEPRQTLSQVLRHGPRVSTKKDKKESLTGEDVRKISSEIGHRLQKSALVTFLRQEIDRYNKLLRAIHKCIKALKPAIKGEKVMSEFLESVYNAILSQKVPVVWEQIAYESRKPLGAWIQDLIQRIDFFSHWSDQVVTAAEYELKGPPKVPVTEEMNIETVRDMPRSFWLSGFSFPQGFLTSVLQNHARKVGVSVDSLAFEFKVKTSKSDTDATLSDIKHGPKITDQGFKGPNPPAEGVLVFGLFLDGVRWDPEKQCLQDSLPGQRFCRLPEIHFKPVQVLNRKPASTASSLQVTPVSSRPTTSESDVKHIYSYECPLYRTSARAGTLSSTGISTNFVTAVNLPSEHTPEFWVMRGVSLLCQLDD